MYGFAEPHPNNHYDTVSHFLLNYISFSMALQIWDSFTLGKTKRKQESISFECELPAFHQPMRHSIEVWMCLGVGGSLYSEVQVK